MSSKNQKPSINTPEELFEEGWRALDKDELILRFCLTDSEADTICQRLSEIEEEI